MLIFAARRRRRRSPACSRRRRSRRSARECRDTSVTVPFCRGSRAVQGAARRRLPPGPSESPPSLAGTCGVREDSKPRSTQGPLTSPRAACDFGSSLRSGRRGLELPRVASTTRQSALISTRTFAKPWWKRRAMTAAGTIVSEVVEQRLPARDQARRDLRVREIERVASVAARQRPMLSTSASSSIAACPHKSSLRGRCPARQRRRRTDGRMRSRAASSADSASWRRAQRAVCRPGPNSSSAEKRAVTSSQPIAASRWA